MQEAYRPQCRSTLLCCSPRKGEYPHPANGKGYPGIPPPQVKVGWGIPWVKAGWGMPPAAAPPPSMKAGWGYPPLVWTDRQTDAYQIITFPRTNMTKRFVKSERLLFFAKMLPVELPLFRRQCLSRCSPAPPVCFCPAPPWGALGDQLLDLDESVQPSH